MARRAAARARTTRILSFGSKGSVRYASAPALLPLAFSSGRAVVDEIEPDAVATADARSADIRELLPRLVLSR